MVLFDKVVQKTFLTVFFTFIHLKEFLKLKTGVEMEVGLR
jgi:hypothetical protein